MLAPTQMQQFTNTFNDWKDFFKQKLTAAGLFHLGEHTKDRTIEIEIYASTTPGFKTTIEIGYDSPFRLAFLRILNPFTPGLNERQKRSYFHQNDFSLHSPKDQEGLEFDNSNLRSMDDYLSQGLKGIETVHIRNGKPVKSVLKSNSFPWTNDTLTFYFETTVSQFAEDRKLTEEESYDQSIEINLHEIYPGTNHS